MPCIFHARRFHWCGTIASRGPSEGCITFTSGSTCIRRDTLLKLASLPTGRLEDAEKLEQLRALEHGIPIRVWETKHASLRVDTPEDVESRWRRSSNSLTSSSEIRALKAAPSR